MKWFRSLFVSIPFVIAAVLNIQAYRIPPGLARRRIEGYGFLFGSPWAWLLDHDWMFPHFRGRWIANVETLFVILWGPAILYAFCLWIMMNLVGRVLRSYRFTRREGTTPIKF